MEEDVDVATLELGKLTENIDTLEARWLYSYSVWQTMESDALKGASRSTGVEGEGLGVIAGTICSSKILQFRRLAHRATRGYATLVMNEWESPKNEFLPVASSFKSEDMTRHVFVGVFGAGNAGVRLKKLAESMDATIVLEKGLTPEDLEAKSREEHVAIQDLTKLIVEAKDSFRRLLYNTVVPKYNYWREAAVVHKTVAHAMNKVQLQPYTALGVGWVPTSKLPLIRDKLGAGSSRAESIVIELAIPPHVSPPTYFETDDFTGVFQGIVDSYGVPRYKEINPTVFTIVTFPWMFGMMYGDVGHGLIITFVAAIMILFQKKLSESRLNEMVAMVFGARYLLLLMGLFGIYFGFLYNDTFGFMLDTSDQSVFFDNATKDFPNFPHRTGDKVAYGFPHTYTPPLFGIDSQWAGATRKIEMYNSFKMKNAVIVGVLQMMLGLILQLYNSRYFGDWKHIYFGFIPEVVFLTCTFGYMCSQIILKWLWVLEPRYDGDDISILKRMVDFFLQPGSGGWYEGLLLFVAAVCVFPFMLIPIPYIEWKYNNKTASQYSEYDEENNDTNPLVPVEMTSTGAADDSSIITAQLFPVPPPHFDMQEVVIKQVIHSIEYVLGSVSNTASYLRLWALSLAHAQLSEVFLEQIIMEALHQKGCVGFTGYIMMFAAFAVWLSVTLGVLIGMEALSAFLHALRLHWVEFQNKFYFADGVAFHPLDFGRMVEEEVESDDIEE
eukprot:TRINITY_DN10780_c0_g1_i1.p1 TRINITY_DN10780_c0_g1~~TRINITY_DN10780_c0_g1_i1.p1  ORF type:complete len:839 (+),score=149.06 TRINITY_DN10780_c0_g1_i1:348-2519(+)